MHGAWMHEARMHEAQMHEARMHEAQMYEAQMHEAMHDWEASPALMKQRSDCRRASREVDRAR